MVTRLRFFGWFCVFVGHPHAGDDITPRHVGICHGSPCHGVRCHAAPFADTTWRRPACLRHGSMHGERATDKKHIPSWRRTATFLENQKLPWSTRHPNGQSAQAIGPGGSWSSACLSEIRFRIGVHQWSRSGARDQPRHQNTPQDNDYGKDSTYALKASSPHGWLHLPTVVSTIKAKQRRWALRAFHPTVLSESMYTTQALLQKYRWPTWPGQLVDSMWTPGTSASTCFCRCPPRRCTGTTASHSIGWATRWTFAGRANEAEECQINIS